ncbi:DUF3971 domain-containing protein [Halorhodospira halophila]|nr:DUF3971 domain-containing protein [Halorhodospira halophila]
MRRFGLRVLRGLRPVLLVALAGAVALRLLVWLAPPLTSPVERLASQALEAPVTVERAELAWRGVWPGIELHGVRVGDEASITLERATLTPAPLESLRAGAPRWAAASAAGVRATLVADRHGWSLPGLTPGGEGGEPRLDLDQMPRRLAVADAALELIPRRGAALESARFDIAGRRSAEALQLGLRSVEGSAGLGRGVQLAARLPRGDPGSATVYAALDEVAVAPWAAALAETWAAGTLDGQLWLEWADGRADAAHGALRANALGMEPRRPAPGFDNLSATARFAGRAWVAELDAAETAVDLPWLFAEAIAVEQAEAQLVGSWQPGGRWSLRLPRVVAENTDTRARGRGSITGGDGDTPRLFIRASADEAPVERVPAYVPTGITPPAVVEWLEDGLLDGTAHGIEVLFFGRPDRFPFDGGEGVFDVRARVSDAQLRYDRSWPRLTGIDAGLRFHNASMTITGRGVTNGVDLRDVAVGIDDLREPILTVRGRGEGDAAGGLGFLAGSPLGRDWIGDPVPLYASGPMSLDLDFALPLEMAHPETLLLDGRVQLDGVEAGIDSWVRTEALVGALGFDARGVHSAEGLHGRWGGEPVTIGVTTASVGGQSRILLDAAGHGSPGSLLEGVADDPAWLSGAAPWAVRARLPAFQPHLQPPEVSLRVRSGLQGVGLDLPAPFGVQPDERRDVQVDVGFSARGLESYWLHYGDELLRAGAAADEDGLPQALAMRLGAGALRLPSRGSVIEGRLEQLDADVWRRWLIARLGEGLSRMEASASHWLPPLPLRGHLRIGDLTLGGRGYGDQTLAADWPADQPGQLALRGDLVSGQVTWDEALQRVRADLDHLDLPVPRRAPDAGPALADPRPRMGTPAAAAWPEVDVDIASVRLAGRVAGVGRVRLRPRGEVLYLDEASIRGPTLHLVTSGEWRSTGTALRGRLRSGDAGDLFGLLQAPRAVTVADVDISAELGWPQAPWGVELADLVGAVRVRMNDGRITDVDPGAGRLVGLLGLRMLPRRILLDFADLSGEGFAFDRISGRITAAGGYAHVDDLRIAGPAARVTISGNMDLTQRVYDNHVVVEPRLGATLPLLGALLGGGVGAAGGFLADQLLGQGVDRAAAVRYRVAGPWHEPRVMRLGVEDATQR